MNLRLHTSTIWLLVVGLLVLAPAGTSHGQQTPAKLAAADADRFEKKWLEIERYGARGAARPFQPDGPRRTVLTEAETNAYLRLRIPSELPPGMVDPYISALGGGRVSARAILDLDAVRRGAAKATLDLTMLLTGRLPVAASGILRTRSGMATFELESASIAGIPIPKSLLQLVVTHYSRSAEFPNGISLDAQFALRSGIREIDIQNRQAVIVQ